MELNVDELDKMKLQLCLMLLLFCLKEADSKIYSYPSPGDRLSYLCGCESRNQFLKNRQIKCKENKVIQMEPYSYIMRDSVESSNNDCGKFNFTTCKNLRPKVLDRQNRLEIYKKCTFKNSCDINIAGVEEGKQRLVNYPFYCHTVSVFNDISVKRDMINPNAPILYLTGENHTGQKNDYDCVVTGPATIRLEVYFIHLKPTSCSKVKFLSRNVPLFGCSTNDTTILYVDYNNVDTEFKLEIRDMEPDKGDVLFFRLWDDLSTTTATSSMDTTVNTEHPPTSPSTTDRPTTVPLTTDRTTTSRPTTVPLTTDRTTTGLPTTVPLTTDRTTTGLPTIVRPTTAGRTTTGRTTTSRTTTSRTTTGSLTTGRSTKSRPTTVLLTTDQANTDTSATDLPNTDMPTTDRPNADVPVTTDSATGRSISAGNTDHSNNDNYPALFGGILAAIIIIIIIGIGIFCYIRIRRKRQRSPNNLQVSRKGNIAQNDYDEVADSNSQGSSHAGDSTNSKTQNDQPKNNNFDPADSTNKINGSNNQYHVLEMDNVSTPLSSRIDKGAEQNGVKHNGAKHATHNGVKQKAGNQKLKKDDYDHVSDGPKTKISQPIHDDTYNHIDTTRETTANNTTTGENDYNHIGIRNGLLNGDSLDSNSKARINGSNDQCHVLEINNYSTPLNARVDKPSEHNGVKQNGVKRKAGNQKVKKDEYDHISNGPKAKISQPILDDTYNHIDATRDATANDSSSCDDYNHIGIQNGLLNGDSLDGNIIKYHIRNGSKSKISQPIDDDTYNHIDAKMAPMTGDDYDHIGNQNGLLNGKLNPVHGGKKKPMKIQKESTQKDREMKSYVNVNFDPDESTSCKHDTENTEDVDTYNHLQNDL